jgi:hypothetical protein
MGKILVTYLLIWYNLTEDALSHMKGCTSRAQDALSTTHRQKMI